VQQSQKKFIYDGMQVIQERDGDDNVIANNIWDGNIGGLKARIVYDINTPTNPPKKYFYHYDGSGNVTAVTDDNQTTVATYDYDAYGNLISSSGDYALQNPWRFSTKYYDEGSGLYYYGYRFYSPGLGKWINRDPIAESGGVNLYAYVENTPNDAVDMYGLDKWPGMGPMTFCEDLAWRIEQVRKELIKRFNDMRADKFGLFPYGSQPNPLYPDKGTWEGHQEQFESKQRNLRKLLNKYDDTNCKCQKGAEIEKSDVWHWAYVPTPTQPNPAANPVAPIVPVVPDIPPPVPVLPEPTFPEIPIFPEPIPVLIP
jgi:RHS repeat-associated protein